MICNRQEFADIMLADPTGDDTLWAVEVYFNIKNSIFLRMSAPDHAKDMWKWGKDNLTSQAICYSASMDHHWWGFTNMEDLTLWVLKWGQ